MYIYIYTYMRKCRTSRAMKCHTPALPRRGNNLRFGLKVPSSYE